MEKKKFDLDEVFASLTVRAKAEGDRLPVDELLTRLRETDACQEDVLQLLTMLQEERIAVDTAYPPLDRSRIRELDEKIKDASEEERTAAVGGENAVRLYLREIAAIEPLTTEQEQELLYAMEEGDAAAADRLVEGSMLLAVMMAERYLGKGVLFLDLVQEGSLEIMSALSAVGDRPFCFGAFCVWKIDCRLRELTAQPAETIAVPLAMAEDMAKLIRAQQADPDASPESLAARTGLTQTRTEELLAYGKEHLPLPEKKMTAAKETEKDETDRQLSQQVQMMLRSLTEQESALIKMKFGLAGSPVLPLEEIAVRLGITEQEAAVLEQQAMAHLGS